MAKKATNVSVYTNAKKTFDPMQYAMDRAGITASEQKKKKSTASNGGDTKALASQLAAQQQAAALAAQKQQLAQSAYDTNMAALEKAYQNRAALLKSNYDTSLSQLAADRTQGEQTVNQSVDSALKQAYLGTMKSRRELPSQLSGLGITGGAAESTLAGLQNGYLSQRSALEQTRADKLASVIGGYSKDAAKLMNEYNSQLAGDEKTKLSTQLSLQQALAEGIAKILTEQLSSLFG